jgi:regulator of replication initiation timing
MENNANVLNMKKNNSYEKFMSAKSDAKVNESVSKFGKDKHFDVIQVIDGMKARIHQLLNETNQLKYENNELKKQLRNQ